MIKPDETDSKILEILISFPRELRDEMKKLLDYMGEGEGYIAAPAHDIPPDAKPENVVAMIEVLQSQ